MQGIQAKSTVKIAESRRILKRALQLAHTQDITGMRRSEIGRAKWGDLRLEQKRILVPVAKTKRPRVIPLAAPLQEMLGTQAEQKKPGALIIPRRHEWEWEARMVLERLRKGCPDVPRARIRWNAFRHTFGSLLAQEGVSLDKIAAWMGNSPQICRRHYAQFVPRDRHDEDIERL